MNVGVDEAGRGCVFGSVYAACVIWNDNITHPLLKDSKKLSKSQRKQMYDFVINNCIDYASSYCSSAEVDNLNILQATQKAMHQALGKITLDYDHIFVDGNYFNTYYSEQHNEYKSHTCVVKGDSFIKSISAASIIAKVEHDIWIESICDIYPEYDLKNNMGYCTKKHILAIKENGRTICHRYTFEMPYEKI